MSVGKIGEGEDGGAEACKEVEAGNMYGGIYVTGYVCRATGVEARRVVEGILEVSA